MAPQGIFSLASIKKEDNLSQYDILDIKIERDKNVVGSYWVCNT